MSGTQSPWHFLTALDGDSLADRELLKLTRPYELEVVSNMILSSRVSLLYSMSGNGKTSLVNAGIVPEFRERGYAVFRTRPRPPWCINDPAMAFRTSVLREATLPLFTPAELQHLSELRSQMADLADVRGEDVARLLQRVQTKLERIVVADPDRDEFRRHMESKLALPIAEFIGEIRLFLDADARMLFICDQFEELFVHFANTPKLRDLAVQLGDVWKDTSLKAHLLFSMREDWVGSMIEFRSELPDLFVNYFKLDPLHRSRGATVLTEPLRQFGITPQPEAVETILDDLATAYSVNTRARPGAMLAVPSPESDPFIEAPALQIVAERLWETREEQPAAPFTVAHYEWLARDGARADGSGRGAQPAAGPPPGVSPAQHVLDSYLDGLLRTIKDAPGRDADALGELRVDCLYLLTDTVRHRRAVAERTLLAELRTLRPQGLDLPPVDEALLREAVEPLKKKGLVRQFESADGAKQYELVHDFAVRAVVRRWRELDRKRTEALAVLRSEEQKRQTTLTELLERETIGRRALIVLPGLALAIVFGTFVWYLLDDYAPRWLTGAGVLTSVLALLTVAFALREKRVISFALGTGVLAVGAALQWSPPSRAYQDDSTLTLLFASVLVGIPLYLRAVIELVPEASRPPRWNRVARVVLAELVDGWPAGILLVVLAGLLTAPNLALTLSMMTGVALVWVLLWASLLARTGATPGSRVAALRVEDEDGERPRLGQAVVRQLLLLTWTAAWSVVGLTDSGPASFAAFAIPPLLSCLFVALSSHGGNFYDSVARTRVREPDVAHGPPSGRRMPWGLAVVPASILLALFARTEPARQAQSDFATLTPEVEQARYAENEYFARHGYFTTNKDSLARVAYFYPVFASFHPLRDGVAVHARYMGRGTECISLLGVALDTGNEGVPFCRRIPVVDYSADTAVVTVDTAMAVPMPADTGTMPIYDTVVTTTSVDTMAMDTTP